MPRPLRVLTLNCWNIAAPFDERMALAREGIAALEPDVVGLQEIIVRQDGFDQSAMLLAGLGYECVFGAAFRWGEAGAFLPHDHEGDGFGNVVASRWPILRSHLEALPQGHRTDDRRSMLAALIDTPGGRLPFVTTHLSWKFDEGWMRERQVLALARLVEEWAREGDLPPIVTGDLNADPEATEIRFLKGLASLAGRSVYLQDAWAVAGDGSPGFTWDNRNPYAATMFEPTRRIDYVLVGLPDPSGRGWVESARVVLDQSRDGVFPSDHFGVVADVRMLPHD